MHNIIIDFWFDEIETSQWWKKDLEFDALIQRRFGELHQKAKAGELFKWRETALGSLAEVIILDQFSRNMFRDHKDAFSSDELALALAQGAISKGFDTQISSTMRSFLYLPFMHSESAIIHAQAVKLYESLGNPNNLEFEHKHKAIIDRFGRYPHRNTILGRESTMEEIEFLKQPNSSF
ncbi:DUF924 family protein [Oceaniserpentilla sp. 4NH20-0058]|uniref:DUF924 family protein n=1 Tax=Oceaniserpentilla sp. 4NH20-0058 TaxID=3127660 RepID=UPI003109D92E